MSRSLVTEVVVATHRLNEVVNFLQPLLPNLCFRTVTFDRQSAFHKLQDEDVEKLMTAEILITDNPVIPQVVHRLPNLLWVQGSFAGLENVLSEIKGVTQSERDLPIITRFSGDKYGQLMFEYALSFIIGNERGFTSHVQLQSGRDWYACKSQTTLNFRTLDEITVSVLGLGAIGSSVCKLFKQMGCRTKGFSRTQKSREFLDQNGIDVFSARIEDALRDTDYVISILPHSVHTIGLLDNELEKCNSSPVLINMGRGSVVGATSLISALDKGLVSRAVLDVFETEPLPSDSPLWTHARVIVTPHVAAETRARDLADLFVQNYQLFVRNEALKFQVDVRGEY